MRKGNDRDNDRYLNSGCDGCCDGGRDLFDVMCNLDNGFASLHLCLLNILTRECIVLEISCSVRCLTVVNLPLMDYRRVDYGGSLYGMMGLFTYSKESGRKTRMASLELYQNCRLELT